MKVDSKEGSWTVVQKIREAIWPDSDTYVIQGVEIRAISRDRGWREPSLLIGVQLRVSKTIRRVMVGKDGTIDLDRIKAVWESLLPVVAEHEQQKHAVMERLKEVELLTDLIPEHFSPVLYTADQGQRFILKITVTRGELDMLTRILVQAEPGARAVATT